MIKDFTLPEYRDQTNQLNMISQLIQNTVSQRNKIYLRGKTTIWESPHFSHLTATLSLHLTAEPTIDPELVRLAYQLIQLIIASAPTSASVSASTSAKKPYKPTRPLNCQPFN
ncbi:hypothetical protein ACMFMG_001902 [Clarireedia jacksonii]